MSYNPTGLKGVYIAWEASATSMYGWYGGGGSAGAFSQTTSGRTTKASSGSIGNLVTFAAAGKTQTNGYTTDAGTGSVVWSAGNISATTVASGSGGGGGGGSNGVLGTAGGSGVIGVKITSKG